MPWQRSSNSQVELRIQPQAVLTHPAAADLLVAEQAFSHEEWVLHQRPDLRLLALRTYRQTIDWTLRHCLGHAALGGRELFHIPANVANLLCFDDLPSLVHAA